MKPRIGITTYGRDSEQRYYLPAAYVDAVRRAQGIPVLLPPGECGSEDILEGIQGLILAGGGDLAPQCYSGAGHLTIYGVDAERDASEIALVRAAVERKVPLLGICRGCQVLNVALGGTLIPHLPDMVGERVFHRSPPRQPTEHGVFLVMGSRFAEMLGDHEMSVVSWHHQAIDAVASQLQVLALAPDGVIEAVQVREHPWAFGVQWHPELSAATEPHQQRLFAGLVAAARLH